MPRSTSDGTDDRRHSHDGVGGPVGQGLTRGAEVTARLKASTAARYSVMTSLSWRCAVAHCASRGLPSATSAHRSLWARTLAVIESRRWSRLAC